MCFSSRWHRHQRDQQRRVARIQIFEKLPFLCLLSRLTISTFVFFLFLAWKLRMALPCAAVLQTHRRLQVRVWFCTPAWRLTAREESPSYIVLTATMNFHLSPCLETPQLSESCEFSEVCTFPDAADVCLCFNAVVFSHCQTRRRFDRDPVCPGENWLPLSAPPNQKQFTEEASDVMSLSAL